MSVIDPRKREVQLKIVYYGMGLSGKTTNLAHLHHHVIGEDKSEFLSIATEGERTLFFDYLPVDLGTVRGFRLRMKTYTVPGQSMYSVTRSTVLNGADGVVMVVDSGSDNLEENRASLAELRLSLERQRRTADPQLRRPRPLIPRSAQHLEEWRQREDETVAIKRGEIVERANDQGVDRRASHLNRDRLPDLELVGGEQRL